MEALTESSLGDSSFENMDDLSCDPELKNEPETRVDSSWAKDELSDPENFGKVNEPLLYECISKSKQIGRIQADEMFTRQSDSKSVSDMNLSIDCEYCESYEAVISLRENTLSECQSDEQCNWVLSVFSYIEV